MSTHPFSRRTFLTRSAATAAATGSSLFWTPAAQATMPMPEATEPIDKSLDAFIATYMAAMNAPGVTLGLTDASHTLRTASYGYANVETKTPLTTEYLFQIGSITKSFVALVLLQLYDEGKLDLHKPVLEYLPWLPLREDYGPIAAHHLLTHTSGLPDSLSFLPAGKDERLVQTSKPGENFHYCNAGFGILGELVVKLAGKPWRLAVQERILTPLEMHDTAGVISAAIRAKSATGYQEFYPDQVYPRQGRLAPTGNLTMDDTAGCIASTPADMAKYARMLVNHGQGPKGRIVSEASFKLMSTPYIKADDFSPTASYGYGIAVDTLDGHTILRHTGGMVAFASSIHVDLDGGVAAFASINAMQGYRPTAVTEYAVRLLNAQKLSKALPEMPVLADPLAIEDATEYAGSFTSAGGGKLEFAVESAQGGKRLMLMDGSGAIPLQHAGGDHFLSTVAGRFARAPIVFGRAEAGHAGSTSSGDGSSKPPVVEVSYGGDWYTNSAYTGPRTFNPPTEYATYAGHYVNDGAWGGEARVYILKGQLFAEGDPLTPLGGALFRAGEESWSPETAEFLHVYEGKARLLKLAGMDFWRVEVE